VTPRSIPCKQLLAPGLWGGLERATHMIDYKSVFLDMFPKMNPFQMTVCSCKKCTKILQCKSIVNLQFIGAMRAAIFGLAWALSMGP
jgi:hypothetical protein